MSPKRQECSLGRARDPVERKVRDSMYEKDLTPHCWFWDVGQPHARVAKRFLGTKPLADRAKEPSNAKAVLRPQGTEFCRRPEWAQTQSSPEPQERNAALPSPDFSHVKSQVEKLDEQNYLNFWPTETMRKQTENGCCVNHWICGHFYSNRKRIQSQTEITNIKMLTLYL